MEAHKLLLTLCTYNGQTKPFVNKRSVVVTQSHTHTNTSKRENCRLQGDVVPKVGFEPTPRVNGTGF